MYIGDYIGKNIPAILVYLVLSRERLIALQEEGVELSALEDQINLSSVEDLVNLEADK